MMRRMKRNLHSLFTGNTGSSYFFLIKKKQQKQENLIMRCAMYQMFQIFKLTKILKAVVITVLNNKIKYASDTR